MSAPPGLAAPGLANRRGRATLALAGRAVDVETRSGGRFPADPMQVLAQLDALLAWAAGVEPGPGDPALDAAELGPCVPRPSKVFGIGLNYRDHAEEASLPIPKEPLVFTKFPSCLAGPHADVVLTGDRVDWEVELVVVIGRRGRGISPERAPEFVAGYCAGQDVSDRRLQFAGTPPQFSLGKSADGFGPIGPVVVPRTAVPDAHALRLSCDVNGERMQDGHTGDMIFRIPELVAYLSRHCTLEPGDLIFTGTPAGVGSVREPRLYLRPGDLVASEVEGIGVLRNRCVAG